MRSFYLIRCAPHRIKIIFLLAAICITVAAFAQIKYPPYVNQAGYNLNESKRFVCYGAADGKPFQVIEAYTGKQVYQGTMLNQQGWFSDFNPVNATHEFVVQVQGHGSSKPFWVANHLFEKTSAKLAYDFFIDVRGNTSLDAYDMAKVYGGGPSRDAGAYGLEAVFEVLQYAANPALYHRWTSEMDNGTIPDLIELILWHAAFAYKYHAYEGPVGYRHGSLGYEGHPRMQYDYWNTLDHLAAVCAAYHSFLKPYLPYETYQKYRQVCLDKWEAYDRHKVVRYWTYSNKWVDAGFQEFNEMGNAYGQSVFSNLFMYLCELNEPKGNPQKYLQYAQASAQDIIAHWDFNNPRHMWWIRNAEHITPQALSWFLLVAPQHAPPGTQEKLKAWAVHIKQKTNNFWQYRTHSETEWSHPKTKELGSAPALGGSLFAAAHLLGDTQLRQLGWSQVDFVFGINPVGTHLGHKGAERVAIGGFWAGVEEGWPQSHPDGYGQLRYVRGTLESSPLNHHFPIAAMVEKKEGENKNAVFGENAYATEGWSISNRGWQSTVTFATLGAHQLTLLDAAGKNELRKVKPGQKMTIVLRAALNQDWEKAETGAVQLTIGKQHGMPVTVKETGPNTGIFTATFTVPALPKGKVITAAYGYFGLGVQATAAVD
ncbi:MAG: hypothetical protein EAY75_05885 [Bacteroidetes bacterium]|nr:MAG: hypothetical protein EAY75_05885 [Bacteroidota bacterium]